MKTSVPYIIIILLAVLLFASVQECSHKGKLADTNYEALTDTVKHYTNRLGGQSASIKTLQLDNSQMKKIIIGKDKELSALAKEFAKVKSVTQYKSITLFDTIQITYTDTIPCTFDRTGTINARWYSFGYTSNQKGIVIDSLKTWTSATIITGIKKKWFLGKQTLTTDVAHNNPFVEVTQLKAAEIPLPQPLYQRWYFWLAAGLVGGYIMAN